jgi:Dolichyl-phosphate-mannose-protein mannosyltransferase
MKRFSTLIILGAILILAAALRLWQLGAVPASPDWDEASLGYNAYSILRTGKDEYGTFLPLSLRSFNDYKPPLYVYLTVPSVALFGLTTWAVRLPSAVFGILAVFGTYLLVRELFKKSSFCYLLSVISSLLLAISPWHIQFSRVAFEANIGVTLNIYAVYFFLRGLYTKSGLIISAILFTLSLYAYHSERIFVPTLIVLLFVLYRKQLWPQKKYVLIIACIIGCIIILPLISVLTNKNALMRLQGTSVFQKQTELLSNTINKIEYDKSTGYWLGTLFDNRRVEYAKVLIRGYLIHFSPNWLFITGDHPRHHAPDMGLLYLWELPFIAVGIYKLLRGKGPSSKLFLGWCLLAPIAATPTIELPHAVRTLVFLPSFQVFTAVGLATVYWRLRAQKPVWVRLFSVVTGLIIIGSFLYYIHMYFVHTNVEYSQYWQYGYKQAVEYAEKHKGEYKKVVVSTDLEQPYMFFLYFTRYDPKAYLAGGGSASGAFDRYEFRKIDWEKETRDGSILYIGTPKEIVHGTKANITALDGTPVIHITDRE